MADMGKRKQNKKPAVSRVTPPAKRNARLEREIDEAANDGRLNTLAMHLAIRDGNDWPSLDGSARDMWNETAIDLVRAGKEFL